MNIYFRLVVFFFALSILMIGCKEAEEAKLCSCSTSYSNYLSSDSTKNACVPNAFSPNGDGVNDLLHVFGQKINGINFRIEDGSSSVFQTNDISMGWDGTVNGSEPTECQNFTYVLDVTFHDGTSTRLNGTVTLLFWPDCPENKTHCILGTQYDGTGFNLTNEIDSLPC